MMTEEKVVKLFEETEEGEVLRTYGDNDRIAMREAFNNFTDMLCKNGWITEDMYNDMDNPY